MNPNLFLLILAGGLAGAASGFLGSFMILKRMALVGDALSHVALPGMAIALVLGINPMLGAFLALTLSVLGIWYLAEKSEIYPETLVGIFFTASLAIGVLITPEPELLEALFGNLEKISFVDGILVAAVSLLILILTRLISQPLMLGIISEDLAKSGGIKIGRINLIYLLLVGLVIALGIKFLGTLLTGALVIVPAAAAKNLACNTRNFQVLAAVFGFVATALGIVVAQSATIASGPAVVLLAVSIFLLSYLFRQKA